MAKVRLNLEMEVEQGSSIADAAHRAVEERKTKKYYTIWISLDGTRVQVGLFDKVDQIVRNYHEKKSSESKK